MARAIIEMGKYPNKSKRERKMLNERAMKIREARGHKPNAKILAAGLAGKKQK